MDDSHKETSATAEGPLFPQAAGKVAVDWRAIGKGATAGLKVLAGVAILAAILVFIWPTEYRYEHGNVNGLGSTLLRVNRFTGRAEPFLDGKWGMPPKRKIVDVEAAAFSGTDGRAGFDGFNSENFAGNIYNKTAYTITSFVVRIVAKGDSGKKVWERSYQVDETIPPLSARTFSIPVLEGFLAKNHEWGISSVKGYLE